MVGKSGQFGVKALLLCTAAIAVLCGIVSFFVHRIERTERAVARIEAMGGTVSREESLVSGVLPENLEWKLGPVSEVTLHNPHLRDADLAPLAGLGDLEVLKVSGHRLDGGFLRYLAVARRLRFLSLDNSAFNDDGTSQLRRFTNLALLSASATPVTDTAMARLGEARFRKLECVSVANTAVSNEGLKSLRNLPGLKALDLSGTRIDDQGLAEIARIAGLTELGLAGTAISGDGIRQLRSLRNLKYLQISATQLDDDALMSLAELPHLEAVARFHTNISDAGARRFHLARLGREESHPTGSNRRANPAQDPAGTAGPVAPLPIVHAAFRGW